MSGAEIRIDARGLACPQPVVLAKKAIEENPGAAVAVVVDGEAARENVLRFAAYAGRAAKSVPGGGGATVVEISAAESAAAAAATASAESGPGAAPGGTPVLAQAIAAPRGAPADGSAPLAPETIFIAADRVGQGDDELGRLLMKGFLYALAEGERLPRRIILMNSGVSLAAEGSASLANLRRIEARGVEILACGTCLDFFALKASLGAGRVSNMYEIAALLMEGTVLRL